MHLSPLPIAGVLLFLYTYYLRADTEMTGEFPNRFKKYSKHYYLCILEVMQPSIIMATC